MVNPIKNIQTPRCIGDKSNPSGSPVKKEIRQINSYKITAKPSHKKALVSETRNNEYLATKIINTKQSRINHIDKSHG
jgi:hypothetical protein